GWSGSLVAAFKQIQHKILNAVGPGCLRKCGVPGPSKANSKKDNHPDDRKSYGRTQRHCTLIASNKFFQSVSQAVGTCFQWLCSQVAIYVLYQRFDRAVATFVVLVHRRETQDVQIAPTGLAHERGSRKIFL